MNNNCGCRNCAKFMVYNDDTKKVEMRNNIQCPKVEELIKQDGNKFIEPENCIGFINIPLERCLICDYDINPLLNDTLIHDKQYFCSEKCLNKYFQ